VRGLIGEVKEEVTEEWIIRVAKRVKDKDWAGYIKSAIWSSAKSRKIFAKIKETEDCCLLYKV